MASALICNDDPIEIEHRIFQERWKIIQREKAGQMVKTRKEKLFVTEELESNILALLDQGKSWRAICDALECSTSTINRITHKFGLKKRKG